MKLSKIVLVLVAGSISACGSSGGSNEVSGGIGFQHTSQVSLVAGTHVELTSCQETNVSTWQCPALVGDSPTKMYVFNLQGCNEYPCELPEPNGDAIQHFDNPCNGIIVGD